MNMSTKPVILENFENYFYRRTLKSLCSYELKIYQARIDRLDTKMQRYFNSTPIRNAFASLMVIGACNNKSYTITEIVNNLRSNRQSISTMVDECKKEGWIIVSKNGNKVQCKASEELVKGFHDYMTFSKEISKDYFNSLELLKIKNIMSNELSKNN